MPTKPEKNGLQSTHSRSRRWEQLGRTLGFSLLAVGALLLFMGNLPVNAAKNANAMSQASASNSRSIGTLIKETGWGMWHKADMAQSFPTTQHPYAVGQTITVSNNVSIRVDSVDRNWTPEPWQVSPYSAGFQDDAKGKEVILVRFTITNLSNTPINYSDHYFSLTRANGHEQRVATLAELTSDQYGGFGQASPWLLPGATAHTFVPFLVNPGEQPRQFTFSWQTADPTRVSTVKAANGKAIVMPVYINVARIPIALVGSASSNSALHASATSSIAFVPDTTFKVTNADVYSTASN